MKKTPLEVVVEEYEKLPNASKLALIKKWSADNPDENARQAAELDFFIQKEALPTNLKNRKQVIILIHGIRTHAPWQPRIQAELRNYANVIVIPLGYEFFALHEFLSPFGTRKKPMMAVLNDIRYVLDEYRDHDVSVLAHSFGTYLITKIINGETGIRFKRILFCGSIVPVDTRWTLSHRLERSNFLNDVGTKDYLPVMAKTSTWGYGSSGTFGFKKPNIEDRYHPLGHSDFFSEDHIRRYWTPFLVEGRIVTSDYERSIPTPKLWLSLMDRFHLKYFILVPLAVFIFRWIYFLIR